MNIPYTEHLGYNIILKEFYIFQSITGSSSGFYQRWNMPQNIPCTQKACVYFHMYSNYIYIYIEQLRQHQLLPIHEAPNVAAHQQRGQNTHANNHATARTRATKLPERFRPTTGRRFEAVPASTNTVQEEQDCDVTEQDESSQSVF